MPVGSLIGAGIGAVGSIIGGNKQNKAAEKGADAQAQSAQIASDALRGAFVDTTRLQQGRAQSGDAATARMMQLMGLEPPESLTSGAAYDAIYSGSGWGGAGGAGGINADAYYQANPDVAAAMNGLTKDEWDWIEKKGYEPTLAGAAQYHWDTHGKSEGRDLGAGGGVNGLAGGGSNAINVPELGAGGVSELIKSTPGYQFRFDEGIKAVDSSARNKGMLMSGSAIKRLQDFGDAYAANEFGNYWNRLAGIAGAGGAATGDISGAAQTAGSGTANVQQNLGQGLASSYANKTSPVANALGVIGGGLSEYYG